MNTSAVAATDSPYVVVRPLAPQARIRTLDVIRGLGVLGILIVNIQSFALPSAARSAAIAPGDDSIVNRGLWFLIHVLADGKFMAVFSLLFGAGICLISDRIEDIGMNSAPVHFRRMGFLMLVGLLHSYLLWSGDILFAYGLCGSICWFFRKSRALWLFLLGLMALMVGECFTWIVSTSPAYNLLAVLHEVLQEVLQIPTRTTPAQELLAYRGNWMQQMTFRVPSSLDAEFASIWIVVLWRIIGAFFIGMGLMKTRFLLGTSRRDVYRWALLLAAAALLLAASAGCIFVLPGSASANRLLLDFTLNYWLSIPMAAGWMTTAILLSKLRRFALISSGLQAVGRTAFTNYILQTVICTTLFYGHGLGLFGSLTRSQLMLIVLIIWPFEVMASIFWLRYFQFGPIEWIQRRVSYWNRLAA